MLIITLKLEDIKLKYDCKSNIKENLNYKKVNTLLDWFPVFFIQSFAFILS